MGRCGSSLTLELCFESSPGVGLRAVVLLSGLCCSTTESAIVTDLEIPSPDTSPEKRE